jgi:hypothetical protein
MTFTVVLAYIHAKLKWKDVLHYQVFMIMYFDLKRIKKTENYFM